ncbi:MAG TPA: GH92 family glycosyl hydrolase [Chryseolinea sp.]
MAMRVLFSFLMLVALTVLTQHPAKAQQKKPQNKIALVNPFIGTGGHGHTFPGAVVPFGMVQLSPDTRLNGWDACSGYHASDPVILGFSHTHLSGTGIGDYGDILFMPVAGQPWLNQGTADNPESGYCSRKVEGSETATPGYYRVTLKDDNIIAELTATTRAGMHQYTYPAGSIPGLIIDVGHTLQSHQNAENLIEIVNDHEIRGHKFTRGWAREHHVYFHAVFSQPFTYRLASGDAYATSSQSSINAVGAKAVLKFENLKDRQLQVRVGISAVDMEGARNNVMNEISNWNFTSVKDAAAATWSEWLNKVDLQGGTPDQQTIFYTALYHSAISPNLYTDWDGRYRGLDKKIHTAEKGSESYTVFSLWDTFRAFHPLMTIINPSRNEAWVRTLITKYEQDGVLPMWELAANETGTMIGYHSASVIADAYLKGNRNFNVQKAYEGLLRAPHYDTVSVHFPDAEIKNNVMPVGKYYNETLGFIPCDKDNESVSKALEYAYDDWCIAQMAKALGKTKDYEKFMERSRRYVKYFDKRVGFMRGVNADGSWKTPFNPRFSNHRRDEYVEGNSWQWSWFVPHDIDGLMALHGGRKPFIQKLDSLFSVQSDIEGNNSSADITGLVGQYAHGNEPSHHIAYLYNYVGQPWKTQELADKILNTLYFNDANGLSGNEDCGQMSAWYILSSLGIYQVSPGDPTYTLGRPLFSEAKVHLENGKTFVVKAQNNSVVNKYVAKVSLNGTPLKTPFITHEDILKGGTLEFVMSAHPAITP